MIEIYCSYSELVEIDKLVPHPKNANTHPDNQLELLAKIIRVNGWRNPIVVSKRSGYVIKGHGRLEAAKLLGENKVPVEYQEYQNEAEEYRDMIADNRIQELSEMDSGIERELLMELRAMDEDLEAAGFRGELENEGIIEEDDEEDGFAEGEQFPGMQVRLEITLTEDQFNDSELKKELDDLIDKYKLDHKYRMA